MMLPSEKYFGKFEAIFYFTEPMKVGACFMARKSQTVDPWAGLNERQQSYLKAIYQADQKAEADEKYAAASNWNSRPANEWRWLLYGYDNFGFPTPLLKSIMDLGLKDQGTGSTFEALETRKLILVKYTGALDDIPLIRITPKGRKLVHTATQEERPVKLPAGTLREWHWRALAKCYEAYINGKSGVQKDDYLRFGGLSWKTWLHLLFN
ncbi:hypothetical protein ACFQ88_20430 [Paenibacillus sp. NPDC056579]|uniref:hypothetical protein n=1 Tax=Paenibacillus sp. NPDC056579 TaxID=3345871 RepID=UPI003694B1E0